jgi:hypothetical protein
MSKQRIRKQMLLIVWLAPMVPVFAGTAADIRNTELRDYNTHFEMRKYTSASQWEARRAYLRGQILFAAGLLPMPAKSPLNPRIVRRIDRRDYSVEVVLIETLPGYFLAGNLYRPMGSKAPAPAVLLPHGHWKRGRLEDQPSYSVPAVGINLARQGYVAFAYDMVGYNDTKQIPHSFGGWAEQLWSFNTMGLQLWNSIRALDFLQSLPGVDPQRIAATGASGGATQTFLLTAVDDRVRYAAPVNMVSAYMQGGDPCEEAPNLRLNTSNVEIASMMAPRPMLIVSSTHDWTRHTPAEEFPSIQRIYKLYGALGEIENAHIDAEHNYNRQSREAVYRFFAKRMRMGLEAVELTDKPFEPLSADDLLAFPEGAPPPGALDLWQLFRQWKAAARLHLEEASDLNDLRQQVRYALGTEWPAQTDSVLEAGHLVLSRPGKGDRVRADWMPGKGNPVLLVHPLGIDFARKTALADEIVRTGRPLLLIDPFRSAPARTENYEARPYFLSYNQTDDVYRVQDVLTALSFLRLHTRGKVELIGLSDAGIWCLYAAAVAPIEIDLLADLNGFSGSDADFHDRFFVPGIQRVGGLQTALRLVNKMRVVIPARRELLDSRPR